MGRKSKKAAKKDGQQNNFEEKYKKAPHTFVIPRGHVGKNVGELCRDMRRVMEPFTASNLKVRRKNVLKDFISMAGPLNVSHMIMFTKTETSSNMKLMKLPRGPTLTFKVNNYSLCRDVISSIKRHNMEQKQFLHHPLLVMNNLSGEGMHLKLMATMFQNMFPSISVNKIKLKDIRRCVLLNYDNESENLEFRHYNVKAVPVGMSRGVKKIIKAKVPNMAKLNDISEYLLKDGNASESEAELDGDHNEVILPQDMGSRGNMQAAKSAIRLTEIGPRMSLQLVKIEDGLCNGEVMYHQFVEKTEEELKNLKEFREKKKKLKEQRKREQEENKRQKEIMKEINKKLSLAGMKKKQEDDNESDTVEDPGSQGMGDEASAESESDDDVEYYKKEVGEAPDPDLFVGSGSSFKSNRGRKRKDSRPPKVPAAFKKRKMAASGDGKDKSSKFKGQRGAMGKGRDQGKKFGGPKGAAQAKGGKRLGKKNEKPKRNLGGKMTARRENFERKKFTNKNKKSKRR